MGGKGSEKLGGEEGGIRRGEHVIVRWIAHTESYPTHIHVCRFECFLPISTLTERWVRVRGVKTMGMHKDKGGGERERVGEDEGRRVPKLPKTHGQLMKPWESDGEDFLQVSPEAK